MNTIQKRHEIESETYVCGIIRVMNTCIIFCITLFMMLVPYINISLAAGGPVKQVKIVYTSDTWGYLKPCST